MTHETRKNSQPHSRVDRDRLATSVHFHGQLSSFLTLVAFPFWLATNAGQDTA